MRSPADMEVIQIEITNACIHNCANCTRFCGLHRKPFFMDPDTFKRAVDSFAGYRGVVGIMGGEPTLHPHFAEFMEYYRSRIPEPRPRTICKLPLADFRDWVSRTIYQRGRHRGLWSSLGRGYYKHYELIQDVFPYQVLNDHRHVDQHQALLIPRKELGIPDDRFFALRDRCWIQNLWSASITPKGAFFCEIAASLDMLFDGPGGWPIEPGWWRRKPEDFGDQLHWCELCSAALNVPSAPAASHCEIMSPGIFEKLRERDPWKIRTGHYRIFRREDYVPDAAEHDYRRVWFLPDGDEANRTDSTTPSLFPRQLDVCVRGDAEHSTVSEQALRKLDFDDFLVFFASPEAYDAGTVDLLRRRILNPGFIYHIGDAVWVLCRRAAALKGLRGIDPDKFPAPWSRAKYSHFGKRELKKRTLRQKLAQLWAIMVHRGAFLLPGFDK